MNNKILIIIIIIILILIFIFVYKELNKFKHTLLTNINDSLNDIKKENSDAMFNLENNVAKNLTQYKNVSNENLLQLRKIALLHNQSITRISNHFTEIDEQSDEHVLADVISDGKKASVYYMSNSNDSPYLSGHNNLSDQDNNCVCINTNMHMDNDINVNETDFRTNRAAEFDIYRVVEILNNNLSGTNEIFTSTNTILRDNINYIKEYDYEIKTHENSDAPLTIDIHELKQIRNGTVINVNPEINSEINSDDKFENNMIDINTNVNVNSELEYVVDSKINYKIIDNNLLTKEQVYEIMNNDNLNSNVNYT